MYSMIHFMIFPTEFFIPDVPEEFAMFVKHAALNFGEHRRKGGEIFTVKFLRQEQFVHK